MKTVVVGIMLAHRVRWFLSNDDDLWILDRPAFRRWFAANGMRLPAANDADRGGLEVVDSENAEAFVAAITRDEVSVNELALMLPEQPANWDDVAEWLPTLLIAFDRRQIWDAGESPDYLRFAPPGWTKGPGSLYDAVPAAQKYWVEEPRGRFHRRG